jgi:holliday junction DNA helicase RuvA
MISFLEGELVEALPTQVLISVQGVGYLVYIPLSSFDHLPAIGQRLRLLTHFIVREDAHLLFGFVTVAERDLFRLLVQHVSGVGPKLALAVLSGMSVGQFKAAVVNADVNALSRIIGVAAAWQLAASGQDEQQTKINDAVLALLSLGFKQVEAQRAVREILSSEKLEPLNTEELVRRALKRLA